MPGGSQGFGLLERLFKLADHRHSCGDGAASDLQAAAKFSWAIIGLHKTVT